VEKLDQRYRIMEDREYENLREKGITNAIKKRDIEIAKKMLKEGVEITLIAKITGLSSDELAVLSF